MRFRAFLAVLALVGLVACGNDVTNPSQPSTYGNPQLRLSSPRIVDQSWSNLVTVTPPSSTVLRDGQYVDLTIRFHLPVYAYPTSVVTGLMYKNKAGGTSGLDACIERKTQWQDVDTLHCRMRVDATFFNVPYRPEYGIAPDSKVDVFFETFNWNEEKHPNEVRHYNEFGMNYTFQP